MKIETFADLLSLSESINKMKQEFQSASTNKRNKIYQKKIKLQRKLASANKRFYKEIASSLGKKLNEKMSLGEVNLKLDSEDCYFEPSHKVEGITSIKMVAFSEKLGWFFVVLVCEKDDIIKGNIEISDYDSNKSYVIVKAINIGDKVLNDI